MCLNEGERRTEPRMDPAEGAGDVAMSPLM